MDKQIALFGELTYKITDTTSATAGVRVSKVDFYGTTLQGGAFLAWRMTPRTNCILAVAFGRALTA